MVLRKKNKRRSLGIYADLVGAIDWYDNSLRSMLDSQGLQFFNRTQSILLIHIAEGITRPTEIAYEMGATRQNIHATAKPLIDNRIIELVPDPNDGRSKLYVFCEDSLALRDATIQLLKRLDRELAARIGKDEVKSLKIALSRDWGDVISEV